MDYTNFLSGAKSSLELLQNFTDVFNCGRLVIYDGPMKGFKSHKFEQKMRECSDTGRSVLVIRSEKDTRNKEKNNTLSFHDPTFQDRLGNKVAKITANQLHDIDVSKYEIVGIDDAQFFDTEDIYDTILRWVNEEKKHVYLAGLDLDYTANIWGGLSILSPHAEESEKFRGVCERCVEVFKNIPVVAEHCRAIYCARISESTDIYEPGSQNYKIMCRFHYLEHEKSRKVKKIHIPNPEPNQIWSYKGVKYIILGYVIRKKKNLPDQDHVMYRSSDDPENIKRTYTREISEFKSLFTLES